MKKSLIISLITIVFILLAWTNTSNAAATSIYASSATVGSPVTVTVSFGENVSTAQFALSFDSSKVSFASCSAGSYNPSSNLFAYFSSSNTADLSSINFTFNTIAEGSASFNISGVKVSTATAKKVGLDGSATSASIASVPQQPPVETPVTPTTPTTPVTPTTPETPTTPSTGGTSNSGSNTGSGNSSKPSSTTTNPTFSNTNKTYYTTQQCYLRSSWSTSSNGTLVNKDTKLTVTGTSTQKVNGYVWYRVSYNGATRYIASDFLTTTKPETNKNNTTNNTTTNNTVNNTVNNETNSTTNNEVTNSEDVNNELENIETNDEINNEIVEEQKETNYVEIVIISVIVVAILVIIVSEIIAKRKTGKKNTK